jgi:hypothetical protein
MPDYEPLRSVPEPPAEPKANPRKIREEAPTGPPVAKVEFILVGTAEGHLGEFDVTYVNRRAVVVTPPPSWLGPWEMRGRPEPAGIVYALKPGGYLFVDLAGDGYEFARLADARAAIKGRQP